MNKKIILKKNSLNYLQTLRNVKNLWFLNTQDFAKQNARCFREKISRTLSDNEARFSAQVISKKAQLGKGIVLFPTFILIVVIMGIFIFLASGATVFLKAPQSQQSTLSDNLPENNLLLKTIEIELAEGKTEKVLVYDALYLFLSEKTKSGIPKEVFKLDSLLTTENDCYYLGIPTGFLTYGSGKNEEDISYTTIDNNLEITKNTESILKDKIKKSKIIINEKQFIVKYYYGSCPEELR